MTSPESNFRSSLLNIEPLNPQTQQRFDHQIRDLVDQRIKGRAWVYWIFSLLGCAMSTLFFGHSVFILWTTQPPKDVSLQAASFNLGLLVVFIFSLLATILVLYFVIRGRVDFRLQLSLGKFMPAGALALVILSFIYGCDNPDHRSGATWIGVYALAALVFTWNVNLWNRIVAADQHAQEQLLRIEYRLVELAERLPYSSKTGCQGHGADEPTSDNKA